MNGWNVASSPSSTPMPRAPTWHAHVEALRRAARRARGSAATASGAWSRCIVEIESGRPPLARPSLEQIELGDRSARARAPCRSRRPPAARRGRARERAAMPASSRASPRRPASRAPRAVRWLSLRPVVKPAAPASSASRSERAHRCDVVLGRELAGDRALAHHVHAQRVVGHLASDVDRVRHRGDRVHVLGERLPAPRNPLGERRARDVLDALHQLDERCLASGPHRREADAAVAHHAGRDAEQRARRQLAVPRRPGRRSACGCRRTRAARARRRASIVAARRPVAVADRDDPPVLHRRRRPRRPARPVPSTIVPPTILRSNMRFFYTVK